MRDHEVQATSNRMGPWLPLLNVGSLLIAMLFVLISGDLFREVVYESLTPGRVIWTWSSTSIGAMFLFALVLAVHGAILGCRYLWARRPWRPAGLYAIAWCQFLAAYLLLLLTAFLIALVLRSFSTVAPGQTVHGGNLPGVFVLLLSFFFTVPSVGKEVMILGPLPPTWPD